MGRKEKGTNGSPYSFLVDFLFERSFSLTHKQKERDTETMRISAVIVIALGTYMAERHTTHTISLFPVSLLKVFFPLPFLSFPLQWAYVWVSSMIPRGNRLTHARRQSGSARANSVRKEAFVFFSFSFPSLTLFFSYR